MRVGLGYDVHKLVKDRDLVLGGVKIPFEKGLEGHSDADCLLHATCDALLGAAGKKDIGSYFPDTDPKYKDVSSLEILKEVAKIALTKWEILNIDCILILERPKVSSYVDQMKKNISGVLNVDVESIGIKAKTNEGLGAEGKGEAVSSYAIVLLEEK